MNVSCPSCGATYRVDPAKVPASGVRARCTRCGDVMQVGGGAASGPAPGTPASAQSSGAGDRPAAVAGGAAADAQRAEGAVGASMPGDAPSGASAHPPQPEQQRDLASHGARQAAQTKPAPASAAPPRRRPAPAFGSTDPDAKARRLARALISDIVVYHPDRRDRSLEAGTLRQEFREEIQKSWEEYVAQIGDAAARGTPHFREALNEILAGGRPVF